METGNYYQALYDLAALLNSARSPEDTVHLVVEEVAKALKLKGCSLMLLTPDRTVLLHTAAYGLSDWFVRKGPVSADKSMSESLQGKPVVVMDATTDKRIEYREQVKQEGIASILSVPVKLRGEVIGVMRVYTSDPHHFTGDEISFTIGSANFGAIALESAHFYEKLQTDYDALRREVQQRNAEMGYESLAEPPVIPVEEP